MFPYKTSFILDRKSKQALYLQLANQFIQYIKTQKLHQKQSYQEVELWPNC